MASNKTVDSTHPVSIAEFAEELLEEDRTSFTFDEADAVAVFNGVLTAVVIRELLTYGFTYEGRAKVRATRGFTANSHDRWFGPGSSPTHGGSGGTAVLSGFSGRNG